MGIVLDTSFLIQHERGRVELPDEDELGIAAITASELLHGAHRGDVAARIRRHAQVEKLLARLPVIAFDLEVARVHARLWADLAESGRVPAAHDLQVAATAIARGWQVATMDRRHLAAIPGLTLWGS